MRVDLHCDYLTAEERGPCEQFKTGGTLQCFAAFVKEAAAEYSAAASLFGRTFAGDGFKIVVNAAQTYAAWDKNLAACALTCENIGFTGGDAEKIKRLKDDGVIMASLVWNEENSLAYPNVCKDKRQPLGLKDRGRQAAYYLEKNKIIIDVSHLSDGGVEEILKLSRSPVVASHSCCAALCPHARNLTDVQLKEIADGGGVVGLNFYKKFLGGRGDEEAVCAHIKHIINVAGEDAAAFGSDWYGVPEGGICIYPRNMPRLMQFLRRSGLTQTQVEKVAWKNFMRVFREVRP